MLWPRKSILRNISDIWHRVWARAGLEGIFDQIRGYLGALKLLRAVVSGHLKIRPCMPRCMGLKRYARTKTCLWWDTKYVWWTSVVIAPDPWTWSSGNSSPARTGTGFSYWTRRDCTASCRCQRTDCSSNCTLRCCTTIFESRVRGH